MRRDLVWRQELEIGGRIGDDVALGTRVLLDAGGRVSEPIETDAEDAEQPEHVREQVAILHAILNTNNPIQSNPRGPAFAHLMWPAARHSCSKRAFKQKCLRLMFERTVVR